MRRWRPSSKEGFSWGSPIVMRPVSTKKRMAPTDDGSCHAGFWPARHLVRRAVPVLRYLERPIHPRRPTPLDATKRLVGAALVIALISLADLEEDGSYSRIALRASVIVLAVELAAV